MGEKQKKNSSIVTIFLLWNTMMGVSLTSMPWALHQTGLIAGLFVFVAMGLLCWYTTYLVVQSPKKLKHIDPNNVEFTEVCREYLGRPGEVTAILFSIFVLSGAVLAYYVLMSNFLFFTGNLIYGLAHPSNETSELQDEARCNFLRQMEGQGNGNFTFEPEILFGLKWSQLWQLRLSVPILLSILTFTLLNFKSPTFFSKFNVLGTVSIAYLLLFNGARLIKCGVHVSLTDVNSEVYTKVFDWNFPALTGALTLSYFIQNVILSVLKNQKNPENNIRDLSIGFALVACSYIFVAVSFYIAYPFEKRYIQDNLLNNFSASYAWSAIARVLILFQIITILPLMVFFIRTQLSTFVLKKNYPGLPFVVGLSVIVVICGGLTAIFFPNVGTIVRYVGAISGVVNSYALPCLVYMQEQRRENTLTIPKIALHSLIIVFGVANLIAQFFM
ncbi:unnamed protein product [Cylicocyclus nassatus]|uniref:Amino acid transporter transmembrane domain-containing protein n=1 Tax=Cylicocyclus nassatus TaxID=53992 RepID=A0AA36M4I2_CYLNA|nr:unnamed protein product [Cylicocyclus nassatus]